MPQNTCILLSPHRSCHTATSQKKKKKKLQLKHVVLQVFWCPFYGNRRVEVKPHFLFACVALDKLPVISKPCFKKKKKKIGTSLVGHWLRHCASTAGNTDSIPGRGTKTSQATQQKNKYVIKNLKKRYLPWYVIERIKWGNIKVLPSWLACSKCSINSSRRGAHILTGLFSQDYCEMFASEPLPTIQTS